MAGEFSGGKRPVVVPPKRGNWPACRGIVAGILLKLPASGAEKCIKTVLTQSIFLCAADIDHRQLS
jgi:hypothetical protein